MNKRFIQLLVLIAVVAVPTVVALAGGCVPAYYCQVEGVVCGPFDGGSMQLACEAQGMVPADLTNADTAGILKAIQENEGIQVVPVTPEPAPAPDQGEICPKLFNMLRAVFF